MLGISSSSKEQIANVVEEMFDSLALKFIGDIPRLKNKKLLVISSEPNLGLSHLFIQAMENKVPNHVEKDVLKSLLNSAFGYIEGLKSRTMSNVAERIDGLVKDAKLNNRKPNEQEVQDVLDEELQKARSQMLTIAEAESTKLRNVGTMMQISRVASDIGDSDPTVFFIVIRDNVTCKECIRLHLMPNQITPRLWKFSELKNSYGKRGDQFPSLFNRHPGCRCSLSYLSSGFSFNEQGKVTYKQENYDAYAKQRS